MAGTTEIVSFVKSSHVCDIKEPGNGDNKIANGGRNRHLLLSTTYGLNSSFTKKIQVGLQSTKEDCFVPIVKLTSNNADGICLDSDTWQQFQACMDHMRQYLNEDQKRTGGINPIIINNITINFTSAYGARAILVAYKETNEYSAANVEKEEQPPSKKRKTYNTAIVMQKVTFLGLENIIKCIDTHLAQLINIVDTVNTCASYIINEIELKLPSSYIDCEIIKLTIKGNYEQIEQSVRTQINNLTFLDVYFSIVFVEILSLKFNEISRAILQKRKFYKNQ